MKTITIIGAGKLGTSLYRALKQIGYKQILIKGEKPCSFIKNKYLEHQEYINELTGQIIRETDLIFITVQDDQIANVNKELEDFILTNKYVFHTSGALDSGLLHNLKLKGAVVGSFHPIQTFDRTFLPGSVWKNVVCNYEGDKRGKAVIEEICLKLSAKFLVLSKKQKIAMHLASVISANFSVSLLAWAERILHNAGVKETNTAEILYPLINRAVQNYNKKPVKDILSGPLQRGDVDTIKKHLDYLSKDAGQLDKELYKNLTKQLLLDQRFQLSNREKILKIIDDQ